MWNWNSISEKLPSESGKVLVATKYGDVKVAHYNLTKKKWYEFGPDGIYSLYPPDYWMEIPPVPKP